MEVNVIGKIIPSELFAAAHEDETLVNKNDPRNKFVPIEDVIGDNADDIIEYVSSREKFMQHLKQRKHRKNNLVGPKCDCQILVISKDTDKSGVECQDFIGVASITSDGIIYQENGN